MTTEAFIYEAIRTPRGRGKKTGSLHSVKPISLVTGLIQELRMRFPGPRRGSDLRPHPRRRHPRSAIREWTSPALQSTMPGLPDTVGGVQLNRFCASGLEAVNMAAQKVRSGWDELVIAGGVESMSRVPMGSDGGTVGARPRHQLRQLLRAAGRRRRPDRHHRGLHRVTTSTHTRCARRTSPPRRGRADTSPSRSCRSRTSTASPSSTTTSTCVRAPRPRTSASLAPSFAGDR